MLRGIVALFALKPCTLKPCAIRPCASAPRVLLPVLAILLLAGPVHGEWVWTPETGWYNPRSAVQATADELLTGSRQALEAGRHADALHGCRLFLALYPEDQERRQAVLEVMLTAQFQLRDFDGALATIERLLALQLTPASLEKVIYRKYEIGTAFLTGTKRSFLGIPYSGSSYGVEILDSIVERYPYLPFSDDALFHVASYYFRRDRFEEAEFIYEKLIQDYPKSEWVGVAEYQIGNAALRRLKGVEYDLTPLDKAERHFSRYLRDHPGGDRREEAEKALARIDRYRAQRLYLVASFYLRDKQPQAARFYLQKVIRDHPDSEAARQAFERLRELDRQ